MSFEVTALGHQGWSVATATTHVLIDPLLTPGFGHGGMAGVVYPPRRFDFDTLPPVDAVVVTHEHDDHFDIASLSRIDRAVPVYISCRSSDAARTCLAQMGFEVRRLAAGATTAIGDLLYRTYPADHTRRSQGDEWDVFPFVIRQHGASEWFASSVDVAMPGALVEDLAGSGAAGLCVLAHNTTSADAFDATPGRRSRAVSDAALLVRVLGRRLDTLAAAGCRPQGFLLSGGGWAYAGDRAWLNQRVFPVNPELLAQALDVTRPHAWVDAAVPGSRFEIEAETIARCAEGSRFVRTPPRESWPDRTAAGARRLETYDPACGVRVLGAAQRHELLAGLEELARFLAGTTLFGQLHSLPGDGAPEVALQLLDDAEAWTMAYEPTGCCFRRVSCDAPMAAFRSGLECWASDLHALVMGVLAPSALCYAGRMRTWNRDPGVLHMSQHVLWMMAHPLRRPAASAALYASLSRLHRDAPHVVRGRR